MEVYKYHRFRNYWDIRNKMFKIYILACVLVCVIAFPKNGYNTAKSDVDDENRTLFDTHQAIVDQGYPAETHHVITNDGYILEVIRIPHGKNQTKDNVSRPVVFMMHGLLAAASSFIVLGSEYSIGYHLADVGFDVWMGNARGNFYSRFHVTLDPDHPEEKFEFFDFTFEEIGMYDVASMIDYILEETKMDNLHYIGHSQGGTAFLVLSTMRPEYNSKIKGAHLLAAVGYQEYFPNTELAALANGVDLIYTMALLAGLVEYFPINLTGLEKRSRGPNYCFGDIKYSNMCYLVGAREIVDEDTETVNLLAGASLKQVAHFGQNIRDKVFRRWNYGAFRNIQVYGTRDPPPYDLNLISTYVTMYYSLNDNLLDERDVLAMANDITKSKVHKVSRETFLHEDYVAGNDAKELVTNYIIDDILKLEAGDFKDWGDEEDEEEEEDNIDENDKDDTGNNSNSPAPGITFSTAVKISLIFNSLYVFLRK